MSDGVEPFRIHVGDAILVLDIANQVSTP